ncbi:MAG TPA: holo-ACP synthase [Anaeromyxobacter sp.]|nr:holo-ACP synthase [Anaeromyxobacter sp.]
MKGIGADVVSVSRMRKSLARTPGFASRVFTPAERAYCEARRDPAAHFAARFAAKEAFLKALGLGLWDGVALHDIEVRPGERGAPGLWLGPTAAAALSRARGQPPMLTLSHDGDVALAVVVVP